MAETSALSPEYLKQLREEREARLAAKKGASAPAPPPPSQPGPSAPQQRDAAIEIESSDDEVQIIASAPKRKRADDDDEVQFLPSPSKRPSKADDDEIEVLDRPPRTSTGGTFSCIICMDDVSREQRCKLRCGHVFCVECVKGTVKAAIDDKKLDERLRCPDTSCKAPLTTLDVRACTVDKGDSTTWARYQEVATLASLDLAVSASGGNGVRRCPGDKCNYTFHHEPHATSGTLFICPECHEAFCLGCPLVGGKVGPAHDGSCAYVMAQEKQRKEHQAKYDKWSIENAQADEKFNEMMRKERAGGQTKPCPKCKQAITKNHGCDHMTCPCGHEFYWSTGKPYRTGLGGMFGGWGGGGADY